MRWFKRAGLILAVVVCCLPAAAQQPPVQDAFATELKKLTAEFEAAQAKFYEPYQRAKTEEEAAKIRLDFTKSPDTLYMKRFMEFEKKARGTDSGVRALIQILRMGAQGTDKSPVKNALALFPTAYIESSLLEEATRFLDVVEYSVGADAVKTCLTKIAALSPHRRVKAAATFSLASFQSRTSKPGPGKDVARRMLNSVKTDYADTPYAKKADALLFELDNLQVGKTAPDFEAVDQDGVKFKLSDYRGKVVVVDFWGFW